MPIDTGLSVPVFNVIKYVCVLIFIDVLVFRSLRTFQCLFRRYDLYHGRSVALESERFDRYNLWNKFSKRNVSRVVFWVVLISCAYTAEILLEFSSDANSKLIARSEEVNLYDATRHICGARNMMNRSTTSRVASIATKCIELRGKQYTFYKPTWIYNGRRTPICVRTTDNVLAIGEAPYNNTFEYPEGSDSFKLERRIVADLRANSWRSKGDALRAVITISVTHHDVLDNHRYQIGENIYSTGTFFTKLHNTSITCGGNVNGRFGEGSMKVHLLGCMNISPSSWDYVYISGTALVLKDAKFLETGEWAAIVAVEYGYTVLNFAQEAIENPTQEQVLALSVLLSLAPGRDIDSVKKYVIAYKHCEEFRTTQTDFTRLEVFPRARADEVITVSVQEWALATIIIWPMLVWLTALSLNHAANRRGLPDYVQGEKAIARRWLSRSGNLKPTGDVLSSDDSSEEAQARSNSWKQWIQKCIPFGEKSPVCLIVKPEIDADDITISRKRIDVQRDRLRPFKAV